MHVLPVAGNGVWHKNVEHVLRRIDLFNGRRIVAVCTGEAPGMALDPPAAVREAFAGHVHEFIEVPNDPKLAEAATFLPLYERLETRNPNSVTFRCHAKGATGRPGYPAAQWADVMYETCLDGWPAALRLLRRFPVVGPFKTRGKTWGDSESRWFYSGSFWWQRDADVFARDWRHIEPLYQGIEAWPSLHFTDEEAGCLFGEVLTRGPGPYDHGFMEHVVLPELEAWRRGKGAVTGGA
jgi:hypothetical protein